MIVRCGRCRAELEVSGPGEFICPACGTRNAVRGAGSPAGADPYGFGASASGLTVPGGVPPPSPQQPPMAPSPGVNWETCPTCRFRFASGEVSTLTCPNCRTELERGEDGALVARASS